MSKLLKAALAAALGFAVSAPLFAADPQNRTTAWSDAEVRTAMDKCNNLTATPKAKCIVNIRPTAGGDRTSMTPGSDTEANVVKDGNARATEEYSATAKEKFGRM